MDQTSVAKKISVSKPDRRRKVRRLKQRWMRDKEKHLT
jgi:hypothetical protein